MHYDGRAITSTMWAQPRTSQGTGKHLLQYLYTFPGRIEKPSFSTAIIEIYEKIIDRGTLNTTCRYFPPCNMSWNNSAIF